MWNSIQNYLDVHNSEDADTIQEGSEPSIYSMDPNCSENEQEKPGESTSDADEEQKEEP